MRRTSIIALVGAVTLAVVGIVVFVRARMYAVPERAACFPIRGIDVSHHQGTIDWTEVTKGAKTSGLTFAWMKATEGGDFTDPHFAENVTQAERAGLRVGAYHFFTFCRAPAEQADHFLAVVPRSSRMLPPALDVEFEGNCAARPSREQLLRDLATWLDAVEASTKKRPVVYATREVYDAYLAGSALRAQFWIRDLEREPSSPWTVWQVTDSWHVHGVDGPVDLDVFRGDRAAFDAL